MAKAPEIFYGMAPIFFKVILIQKEKKQSHVKNKIIENMTVDESLIDDSEFGNPFVGYLQKNFLPDEDVYKPKKKAIKPKGLELFYNEDSTDN